MWVGGAFKAQERGMDGQMDRRRDGSDAGLCTRTWDGNKNAGVGGGGVASEGLSLVYSDVE